MEKRGFHYLSTHPRSQSCRPLKKTCLQMLSILFKTLLFSGKRHCFLHFSTIVASFCLHALRKEVYTHLQGILSPSLNCRLVQQETGQAQIGPIHPPLSVSHHQAIKRPLTYRRFKEGVQIPYQVMGRLGCQICLLTNWTPIWLWQMGSALLLIQLLSNACNHLCLTSSMQSLESLLPSNIDESGSYFVSLPPFYCYTFFAVAAACLYVQ